MSRVLLVASGNTIRSDDGVGVRAAEELARALPEATLVLRQELQLELTEMFADYDDVYFIETARTERRELRAQPVIPNEHVLITGSHTCSPGELLGLCNVLYGRIPARATLVTIPTITTDFGQELSAFGRGMVAECVTLVLAMVNTH